MRNFSTAAMLGWAAFAALLFLQAGCSDNPATNSPRDSRQSRSQSLVTGDDALNSFPEAMQEESTPDDLPHIVPYLDSTPSAVDGQGTAAFSPPGPFLAGSLVDFEITFTVGEAGIDAGGFVMLQISPWWGWSSPQSDYPDAPGYTRARAISPGKMQNPPQKPMKMHILPLDRVLVSPGPRGLEPGEKIIFNYSGRVDQFAEAEELFQIFVDADADGNSACIAEPPSLRTLALAPTRLNVTSPSQARPGEKIEIRAAPLDVLGNWSELRPGLYRLRITRDGEGLGLELPGETIELESGGGEKTLSFMYTVGDEGIYFFDVEGPAGLEGRSNVTLCRDGVPNLNLYFGDIHGHSRLSDGTGTPEDFFKFAREVSRLDIAALTDHADHGTIPMKGVAWERIKKAGNDAYEVGRFVTYPGFEWTNWKYGHRIVYYRDGDGPIFRSIDPESDTPQKIWKILEPLEAMTIAHHVGGGPISTDWSIEPSPSKEWLVEICSIHGSSEYYGGEAAIYNPREGAFVRDALALGYKLGIIAAGDTHDGHPGKRSIGATVGGLFGVYSPELTREAIWEALKKRQVYGTSGPKIILNFRVADSPMGSEVNWDKSAGGLPIAVRVVACDDIEKIEIIRDGEPVFTAKGDGVFAQILIEDPEPPEGTSWYYVRVLQKDGQMAWSSPVWVTTE
jgi:hypothetical protein